MKKKDELFFRLGTGAFALVLIVIVAGFGAELYRQSRLSIAEFGLRFWMTDTWDPVAGEFGARPFIWGTMYSSILALLISTPVALGIAIYISELAPGWQKRPLMFLTELLAAVPSIVYGLWGVFVLVPLVRQFEVNTPEFLRGIPLFSGPPLGVGMLSAALILAIMVIPFTSSVAREVLRAVPQAQREGRPFEAVAAIGDCAVRTAGRTDQDEAPGRTGRAHRVPGVGEAIQRIVIQRDIVVQPEIGIRPERERP